MKDRSPLSQKPDDSPTLGAKGRALLSLCAVFHLLAVFAEPFRFFSQSPVKPASEEARLLRQGLGPYVDFMYLSHGYSFFAPNPGPAHLLECEMIPPDRTASKDKGDPNETERTDRAAVGSPVIPDSARNSAHRSKWRVFPDRKQDWPRLLYHRYFMLSEFYHNQFAPASLVDQARLESSLLDQWRRDRKQYEQLQKSIEANLAEKYPDHRIVLRRIEHILPSEYQVLVDRWKLTDPRLYVELPEGNPPRTSEESLPKP